MIAGSFCVFAKDPSGDVSTGSGVSDAGGDPRIMRKRHRFQGEPVPKIAADALAKIRAADDAAKKRQADIDAFYAKGK